MRREHYNVVTAYEPSKFAEIWIKASQDVAETSQDLKTVINTN